MPTKHIDAGQWASIEALTIDLIKKRNTLIKEGDVLKDVIAAGLAATSVETLSQKYAYCPRYGVFIHGRKNNESVYYHWNSDAPAAGTVAGWLEEAGATEFIVCVYGKAHSGRTTFATQLLTELRTRGCDTEYFDDMDDDADMAQAWRFYLSGKSAIVVVDAADYHPATERLFYHHQGYEVEEDLSFSEYLQREASRKDRP
ncbi:hypothetical protein B1H58_20590 (plasmid) [Pantoea alhagi]|uniref:Uncharacterized protein n=1 Tax=Pantoea alhagi TaxID=1891675 RepID=A0A1W6BBI1_9GAMM|nr:hypothetical protein [Pantoea alhagi]ARJ44417.1 hypothetical protein B1H58_20590 [Pantoea alhagi]